MVDFKALTATNCWKERWCLPYWVLCFGELSTIFLDIRWMMIGVRLPCRAPLATGCALLCVLVPLFALVSLFALEEECGYVL